MNKIFKFWSIILLDTLGVLLMIVAIMTGWLPGPGGIPLFIIGLSLIAVNHEWAKKYIDLLKDYADKLGDVIFVKRPGVQLFYDAFAPFMIIVGVCLLRRHSAIWMISLGVFLLFMGITFFLGNRGRWQTLKSKFFKNSTDKK